MDRINQNGLVLLGCGKMGQALLQGWLARGVLKEAVHVIDPHPSEWLQGLGVGLNSACPDAPAVVVIAVKPQMMGDVLPTLAPLGGTATLFMSIAAGTTLARFESALRDGAAVVRAMPNTPAAVGRGISAIVGNSTATPADLDLAETLMSAVGGVVRLEGEHQMDAVTGLSGSGPAYVFHMIEAMAQAGVAAGLAPDLAMQLARATVCGAGELAYRSSESAEQLRINVTSPAGTTAAGLAVLMDQGRGLGDLMIRTVAAAAARGRELGQ